MNSGLSKESSPELYPRTGDNMTYLIPSFYIIGERKCGTSSLFRYLTDHPQIMPGKRKEPNFFIHDSEYLASHWEEYLANFPQWSNRSPATLIWPELDAQGLLYEEPVEFDWPSTGVVLTGEASANTFFDVPPQVIKAHLPAIKLILMLRDPVERTFSHYRMLQRFTAEGRDIGWKLETLEREMDREMEDFKTGQYGQLLGPSCYILKLPAWIETFGWDQIRILDIKSINGQNKWTATMRELYAWLGVEPYRPATEIRYNQAPPEAIPTEIRETLQSFFRPFNEQLFDFLGYRLPWDSN